MKNSMIAIIVIVIVVIVAAAAGIFLMGGTAKTNNTAGPTKVSFSNTGTPWIHFDAVIVNATFKNGTKQNVYSEVWLKPSGNVTLDLSNLLGYGSSPLPAGTTIKIYAWKGLYNNTTTGTGNLNLGIQSWSNTINPTTQDQLYHVTYNGLNISKLPANITDNAIITYFDTIQFRNILTSQMAAGGLPLYEEETLTVDSNGKVTIVFNTPATLCNLQANLP